MGAETRRLESVAESARKAGQQLDALEAKINKISSALNGLSGSGLTGLANGVKKLSAAMQNMNDVKTKDFTRLAKNIQKLTALDTDGLDGAASSLSHMTRSLDKVASVSENADKLGDLAKNIAKLGHANVQKAVENMPRLAAALRNLMAKLSEIPAVSNNLIVMTNALARLASQGAGANAVINGLGDVGNVSSGAESAGASANKSGTALKKFVTTLGGYASKAVTAHVRTKHLAQSFGFISASVSRAMQGFQTLGNVVNSSIDYADTFNSWNAAIGKLSSGFSGQYQRFGYDSAEEYADSFGGRLKSLTAQMTGYNVGGDGELSYSGVGNLGLDPKAILEFQAQIASATNDVGFIGESSIYTSQALSMLSADMSSLFNMDMSSVMKDLQSGLAGQSNALSKYGIDISNATLQTYAYQYGISKSVSEMSEAEKMQLRMVAIMEKSRGSWGNMANTLGAMSNQYRILKQSTSSLVRIIGSLLAPVFAAALPVINGVVMALQRMFLFVGKLLGIEWGNISQSISPGYDGEIGGVAEDTSAVAGNIDDASKKAEKFQRTIMGFDQINKLNEESGSDSGASGGSGGSAGNIDLTGAMGGLLSDYTSVWESSLANAENKAQEYADRICAVFSRMWQLIKSGDYEGLGEYIAGGMNFVFEKINAVFNWEKLGPGITAFVDGYCQTVNGLVHAVKWENIGQTIGDGVNVLTNTLYLYLTGIDWVNIGSALAGGMNGILYSIDWEIFGQTIGAWLMRIPKIVYGFVTDLEWDSVGVAIGNAINGIFLEMDGSVIIGGINGFVNGMLTLLKNVIQTVDWGGVVTFIGDMLGNLDWGILAGAGLAVGAFKISEMFGNKLVGHFGKMLETKTEFLKGELIAAFELLSEGGGIGNVFSALFTGVSPAILGIAAGIAVAVAAIVDLWNTSETFRDNVMNMLNIIGAGFMVFKQLAWDEGLKPLWDSIKEFFGSLYQIYEESGLKDIFELVVTGIGYIVSFVLAGLIVILGELVREIANIVQGVSDILNSVLESVKAFVDKNRTLFDGVKQIFHGVTEFLAGVFSGDWERAWEGIKEILSGVIDTFFGIVKKPTNAILALFESMANGIISAFNAVKKALNKIKIKIPNWIPEFGGKTFGLSLEMTEKIHLPRFAKGGFPNTGELFLARENGIAEMVGRMGTRTAVANNGQIVAGIAYGVKNAIVEAVAEVAVAMSGGQGAVQPSPTIDVLIKADSESIYRIVKKGKKKADGRYQAIVPVG